MQIFHGGALFEERFRDFESILHGRERATLARSAAAAASASTGGGAGTARSKECRRAAEFFRAGGAARQLRPYTFLELRVQKVPFSP